MKDVVKSKKTNYHVLVVSPSRLSMISNQHITALWVGHFSRLSIFVHCLHCHIFDISGENHSKISGQNIAPCKVISNSLCHKEL